MAQTTTESCTPGTDGDPLCNKSFADCFRGLFGLYVSGQYIRDQYVDHTSRQRVMGGIGIRQVG